MDIRQVEVHFLVFTSAVIFYPTCSSVPIRRSLQVNVGVEVSCYAARVIQTTSGLCYIAILGCTTDSE
ncbi:MAG: hypothetical protein CMQ11_15015 [Gammaproteobacteria bacterium]|nr:hypothetical protein [Gammaproteobacteria bacterium]